MNTAKFVRGPSPDQIVQMVFAQLFRHITLNDDQRGKAMAVITHFVGQQQADLDTAVGQKSDVPTLMALPSAAEASVVFPGAWDRHVELDAQRDAALVSLLESDADKARFEANASEMRRAIASVRPPEA